jgi:ribosome-associated protein
MIDNNESFRDKKSKSQKKREMHALQELGEELVRLNAEQLAKMPISDELREAVMASHSMHKHGARYRQMQYIGKLMRGLDPLPIQTALDMLRNKNNRATALLHCMEKWRDQLIAGNPEVLKDVLAAFPHADRQYLMRLISNAQKVQEATRTPKDIRELFRYLRKISEDRI